MDATATRTHTENPVMHTELKPRYTIEELHARIAQSERDSAEGRVYDFDEVMRELEEEFAREDKQ